MLDKLMVLNYLTFSQLLEKYSCNESEDLMKTFQLNSIEGEKRFKQLQDWKTLIVAPF